ncbi:efflux RND transporter periplasmic adaptor subunit [Chitiniphilus purpureus]|uniref:Efflux RND transporter periplasmic adaptor subunit n=1 Tax=Chitiniphilus purpureus TaxID=2981137 RepID=A0ABY6DPP9_9NEIS|nr:efflux RND transporter periplasmic adaptor subunit [Chitiniphilus sp. CD1]UXY13888.1 efflux RND transporter periplasmic adaptor subunit [Chitiniphilus sp. CD1]
MNRYSQILSGLTAAVLLAGGGYWLGRQGGDAAPVAEPGARKVLYYRNPMGLPDTSKTPKKDPMGMDYIPVYEGEQTAAGDGKGKIVFYRNPMGLPDTSPTPKQDSMGMDYIPVYEHELTGPNFVRISPEKLQRLGVKTVPASLQEVGAAVRAVGRIEFDERATATIAPRYEGWVERLAANAVGDRVQRGQVLFEAYSPDIYAAQQEYRLALAGEQQLAQASEDARQGAARLGASSLLRLKQWEVPAGEIRRLQQGGEPRRTVAFHSPVNGVIVEKTILQGARFMPGDALLRIADLSRVWLQLDIAEQDLAQARVGKDVSVTLDAYPGEVFTGKVDFVYPTLDAETRTAKVRVVLPNPGNRLKPGLYAQALLAGGAQGKALSVPDSALIDSGRRQLVLVSLGEGRFEAREVKTGARGNGRIAILEGLGEGEAVAVTANFLIDAESNLKAAVNSLGSAPQPATKAASAAAPAAAAHAGDHGGGH